MFSLLGSEFDFGKTREFPWTFPSSISAITTTMSIIIIITVLQCIVGARSYMFY